MHVPLVLNIVHQPRTVLVVYQHVPLIRSQ
jgi:hypothetical protein